MPDGLPLLMAHLPAWTLVLFRLAGLFILAPIFSAVAVPVRLRAMMALCMACCIYPTLLAVRPAGADPAAQAAMLAMINGTLSIWQLVPMVAGELAVGLVLGLGATLPLIGLDLGGRVIDQQLGFGLAGVYNPDIDDQTGVVGQFLYLMAMMIFLILGGHRVLVQTLVSTFDHVPLGGLDVLHGRIVELILALMTSMFELALRVSGPLLCLVFLETIALGFIARTVPQLNILSIGFPLRILLGTGLLSVLMTVKAEVFVQVMRQSLGKLAVFFGV